MTPAAYAPHEVFVAPARGSGHLGRLVAGILVIEFLFIFFLALLGALIGMFGPDAAHAYMLGTTRTGLILQLVSFGLLILATGIILRRQHGRSIASAIGPADAAAACLFAALVAGLLTIAAIEILPPWWDADWLDRIRSPFVWALTLPLALFALLIQTSAEEILYRGYVQQQIAVRFRHPAAFLVLPNLLFALAHWDNGSTPTESWQYLIWAFLFGLTLSDLTARTGNLGAAIGVHMANNCYAFLFYGETGTQDSGLALFLFQPADPMGTGAGDGPVVTLSFVSELAVIGLLWLAARVAIRR